MFRVFPFVARFCLVWTGLVMMLAVGSHLVYHTPYFAVIYVSPDLTPRQLAQAAYDHRRDGFFVLIRKGK